MFESTGFGDLLERVDDMRRAEQQQAQVVTDDREARARVIAEAERLGALELREHQIDVQTAAERDEVSALQSQVVARQLAVVKVRQAEAAKLDATTAARQALENRLAQLEHEQAVARAQALARARARARAQAEQQQAAQQQAAQQQAAQQQAAQQQAQSSASTTTTSAAVTSGSAGSSTTTASQTTTAPTPGHILSSGGFTFPYPPGAASPESTWSQDQGVDISAAGDTPELAVGAGTIVLHGIGGFGPWAPVLHLDTPIDGQSYVYYGHAGPVGQLAIGTHVNAGQVIGSVGPGIVGISSGPHLEIGFADDSGTPVPGTSSLMLSLLQQSYNG